MLTSFRPTHGYIIMKWLIIKVHASFVDPLFYFVKAFVYILSLQTSKWEEQMAPNEEYMLSVRIL